MAKPVVSNEPVTVSEFNAGVSTTERRKVLRKEATFREWMVANQIGGSLTILTMIFAIHNLYPSLRPYTTPFLQLSHYQPSKGTYTQGLDDIYFIISSMLAFTAVRAIVIDWFFQPLARRLGLKQKPAVRFAEQGWLLVYYLTFWTYGMYIWRTSKYWFNFREIWTDWPARDISGVFKLYCLLQLSFWLQQIFVINIEQRRKDHYQMFTHHLITSTLLGSAYVYSFYNVANVVLCIMDIVDYMLPAAKMLKYLGFELGCTIAFGVFLGTWFIARHVIYMTLWWSIYQNVPEVMAFGCYSSNITDGVIPDSWIHIFAPFQDIDGPICMSPLIKAIFLGLLLFLQILSLIWFGMILRIAIKFVKVGSAEDTRSDDEEEETVQEKKKNSSTTRRRTSSSQTTVVSEDYNTENSWSRSVMANGSAQSHPVRIRTARGRVTLSDQNDRKTLLGRIGCDKPS